MRILILYVVLLLLDIYIFRGVKGVIDESNIISTILFAGFYWLSNLLLLLLILDALFFKVLSSAYILYMQAIVFIAYFSKVLIALPFLLEDIYNVVVYLGQVFTRETAVYDPSRSSFIRNLAIGIGAIPSVTLLYGLLGNQYRFRTLKQRMEFKDFPSELDGLKIIQISDIHAGTFVLKNPLHNVVEMINKADPDIVVFTGDLVNDKAEEAQRFKDIFSQIESRYGVFSILGNHDYGDYHDWGTSTAKTENMKLLYDIHRQMGWDLLLNENRRISIKGKNIAIIGVENYSTIERFPRKGDLKKASIGTEDADFKILLSHDPTHWDYEINTDYDDIALTLSGHTHGFQFGVEIPGVFRWSPSQYVYEQWAGLYEKGNQKLYVNRGLGCLGYPGRVGILPEITEITIYTV